VNEEAGGFLLRPITIIFIVQLLYESY
jgi:hypothetical protein